MIKKLPLVLTLALTMNTLSVNAIKIPEKYDWAKDAVIYCVENEIMHGVGDGELALGDNLTREQMAKLLIEAFEIETEVEEEKIHYFKDIKNEDWSYKYVSVFGDYMPNRGKYFNPKEKVTREEFAASLVLVSGLKEGNLLNKDILSENFEDHEDVWAIYKNLLSIAVEKGYMKGDGVNINPDKLLTRAEACMFIYRVLESKAGNITLDLGVKPIDLELVSKSSVTLEQAKAWAKSRGAHERFIDIADLYWEYGEITGICPEILYAQAAKETGFGKYGGRVLPEQNNWAGIKTRYATGDETYDHESFETPEDGVRAHFNHMSAYIGLEPVGEPHGRYYSAKTTKWAGTVKLLTELGGKWCPDLYYGYSIYYKYIVPMRETKI